MKILAWTGVALFTIAFVSPAKGNDWGRFRGPNGTGVLAAENMPSAIGPERNVQWRAQVPAGYSSPVLTKSGVIVTAAEGRELLTICLDAETGERRWTAKSPQPLEKDPRGPNSPVAPSPATDGENVFVFFPNLGLVSYDAEGKLRWTLELGPFNNPYGMGASPIVSGSQVILLCDQDTDSYLLAAHKDTGKVAWKTDRPGATHGFSTPVVYEPQEGSAQIIVSGSYAVTAYARDTGEKVWWIDGLAWQAKCLPIVDGDRLYVSSWMAGANELGVKKDLDFPWEKALEDFDADGDGQLSRTEAPDPSMPQLWFLYDLDKNGTLDDKDWKSISARLHAQNGLFAIRLGGKGNVTESHVLWKYDRSLPNIPSPILYDGILYVLKEGGVMTSLDPNTGEEIHKGRVDANDGFFASPVAADGKLYLGSHSGIFSIIEAGKEWKVLSSESFEEQIWSTPALAPGRVFVRTQVAVYCFGTSG